MYAYLGGGCGGGVWGGGGGYLGLVISYGDRSRFVGIGAKKRKKRPHGTHYYTYMNIHP